MNQKLSLILPVYNEEKTIQEIVRRVESVILKNFEKEIIIIDDGSTDNTNSILQQNISSHHTLLFHSKNQGKGAAIRTGLGAATGDMFLIQDADLEYDPEDIPKLLEAQRVHQAEVVYGSRVLGRKRKNYSSFLFHLGGEFVTWFTNMLYGSHITDEATGYKLFTRKVLDSLHLQADGFEFCAELTGQLLKNGWKILEVPISYTPRSKQEGKKIRVSDGIINLWTLLKIRFLYRPNYDGISTARTQK